MLRGKHHTARSGSLARRSLIFSDFVLLHEFHGTGGGDLVSKHGHAKLLLLGPNFARHEQIERKKNSKSLAAIERLNRAELYKMNSKSPRDTFSFRARPNTEARRNRGAEQKH